MRRIRFVHGVIAAAISLLTVSAPSSAATLEEQRAAFKAVYPAAERGDWAPVEQQRALLENYVLWPDLEAKYLRRKLSSQESDVRRFLDQHGMLKPARPLRYYYALKLVKDGRFADYLAIYDRYFLSLGDASLDCLAAQGLIQLNRDAEAFPLARTLWLTGRSQAEQCDPVFAHFRDSGQLDSTLHRERYELAIERQEFALARYLARSIDTNTLAIANRWQQAQGNPEPFLRRADIGNLDPVYHQQLAYAARRIAYREPEKGLAHWRRLGRDMAFASSLDDEVTQYVALWAARRNHPDAARMLGELRPSARSDEVGRWQIRTALRSGDWATVVAAVNNFSAEEREREQWRYWRAIGLEQLGNEAESMLGLSRLAETRSYYGFLAADYLGIEYAFSAAAVTAQESVIAAIAARPDVIRARELYRVGLDSRARSEWDEAVRALPDEQKTQAALLAHRWNWHSRAIAVAATVGEYDDLDLRYPLPYRDAFERSTNEAGISESWAYGIARSESLFMPDVRSSAGAIGLMQLMPATGRSTAQEIKHPYQGNNTLTDPASNIRIGTRYLSNMAARFDNHPALATAAYNAGPSRVLRWRPDKSAVDARIWVETIPFNETRAYVRRVLTSDVIFHWRLTGQTRRLSNQLQDIQPPGVAAPVTTGSR